MAADEEEYRELVSSMTSLSNEYKELESAIYSTGILANYFDTIQEDLGYTVASVTSGRDAIDKRYFDLNAITTCYNDLDDYKTKFSGYKQQALAISIDLKNCMTNMNNKLETIHNKMASTQREIDDYNSKNRSNDIEITKPKKSREEKVVTNDEW